MALFSFGDIKFKSSGNAGFGATGALLKDPYQSSLLKYPSDLGNTDKGHYLVIHINEQKKSRFAMNQSTGDLPSVAENRRNYGISTFGSNVNDSVSGVQKLADSVSGGAVSNIFNNITNKLSSYGISTNGSDYGLTATRESFSTDFLRTIQRTTDTIALYMPDTLAFTQNQSYSDISLGGNAVAAIAAGGASVVDEIASSGNVLGAVGNAIPNLSPFALSVLAKDNMQFNAGVIAATQMVQNPMMELLYTSPSFRAFQFDFMFYPRDEKEATEVQRILDKLRFHQAPEIAENTNSFFLVPPSEFDIKFYYNGKENENIPRISTCVLETIVVDYAPNGFAAYEVQNEPYPSIGRTGMPVAIRLSLQFKETEYLTKQHYRGSSASSTTAAAGELRTEAEIQASKDLGDWNG